MTSSVLDFLSNERRVMGSRSALDSTPKPANNEKIQQMESIIQELVKDNSKIKSEL